jgi:hypothetical protein
MSETSQGPGWWLAADGRWYPPELAPAAPDGNIPAPGWNPWQPTPPSVNAGLATALRIAFWVMAAVFAVTGLLTLWGWVSYMTFQDDVSRSSYDAWRIPVQIGTGWSLLHAAVSVTLLVLVIVWSWQAHRTVTALGATPRWRIGWTIGSWFTCCAAIVIPKLVLNSIERGALGPRRDGQVRRLWDTRSTEPMGWLWWLAYLGSGIRLGFGTSSTGDGFRDAIANSGELNSQYVAALVASVCGVVAALAGASYFRRMSARLTPDGLLAHRDD